MENQQEKTEFEQIKELLSKLFRYWYCFLISIVICGAIGIAYLKLKTPVFEIKAKALVRKDNNAGGVSEMPLMKSLISGFGKGGGISVEDEAGIMSSHGTIKKMLAHLRLNETYTLSECMGIWKTDLYDKTPITIGYPQQLPDTLNAILKFTVAAKGDKLTIKMKANKLKLGSYETNVPGSIQTPYGDFTFAKTPSYNEYGQSFDLICFVFSYDFQAQVYMKKLEIESEKKTSDVINLKMEDMYIPRAKSILNDIIYTHNQQSSDEKTLVGDKTVQFIDERLKEVGTGLDSIDTKIKRFKEIYHLTDVEVDAEGYQKQQTELMPILLEATSQLEMTKMLDKFLSDPGNEFAPIPLSGLISSEVMGDAILKYNEEVARRNEFLNGSKKASPISSSLNEQLKATRKNLLTALENAKTATQISVNILREKQRELDQRLTDFPVMEKQYIAMKREQEIQQAVYLYMQQKKEETSVTSVSVMPKLRMIDDPYPALKPVSPSLMKTALMVVFFGGILIPVGVIYLISTVSRKKNTSD